MYFSNTQFIDHVKKDTRTRNKLKQYILLLIRLLIIMALVMAFARPVIPVNNNAIQEQTEYVAIYIDNSYSMEAETEKGSMHDVAVSYAHQVVEALPADMKYYIITNDFKPEHQRAYSRDEIKEQFNAVNISPLSKNLNEIISKAEALKGDKSNLDLYLISDFQKNMLKSVDTLQEGLKVNFLPLRAILQNNVFLDSCWYELPVRLFGKSDELSVKISNVSSEAYVDIPLSLFINDTLKSLASVNIEAGESKIVPLVYTNTSKGINRGVVTLTDYPITFDNDLYLSYKIAEQISIYVINAKQENKYLTSLFELDNEYLHVTQVKSGNERIDEFRKYNLIVLNGVTDISSGLLLEIESYIAEGNSLLIIPSGEMEARGYNEILRVFGIGHFNQKIKEPIKINKIAYNNYLFNEVFTDNDNNPDLPLLSNVFPIVLDVKSGASSILSDEEGRCVMASKPYKGGQVYLTGFTLEEENSAFAKHPLFIPVFYNIAIHSQVRNPIYYIAGNSNFIEIPYNANKQMYPVYHIIDTIGTDVIPLFRDVQGVVKIFFPDNLINKGHYKVVADKELLSDFALNYSRTESELEYFEENGLEKELVRIGMSQFNIFSLDNSDFTQLVQEQKHGKLLWKYFVIAAFLLLFVEVIIARWMK